jgi:dTDP-4-dehydro-6-deoxy-alpha-D-glucopyranose 2,3-dehydratase
MKAELEIIKSFSLKEGFNSNKNILDWIKKKNDSLKVLINKTTLSKCNNWFLNENGGKINNRNNSFFYITGIKEYKNNELIKEQPIIVQNEIGLLGIICKVFDGALYLLMQAKIEPGNINKIQLSPTIQATKSNFEQKHGGKKPNYLEYFIESNKYDIIVDQIQSEQSSRFYKKRNRNIMINIGDKDVEILPSYMWMTIGQIKQLMKINNLVNMDTRTVLSCIPYFSFKKKKEFKCLFSNSFVYNSLFNNQKTCIKKIYNKINDSKMLDCSHTAFCSLKELNEWELSDNEINSKNSNFKVIYCNIEIEGREVKAWSQPLLEAKGKALFCLFLAKFKNKYKFLVKIEHEIGCFDNVELGPTLQVENHDFIKILSSKIGKIFDYHTKENKGILYNVVLSEEGGRFFQEQNNNMIIEIDKNEIKKLPKEYFWVDFKTLNYLVQFNNVLNIQLRNLLSLLEA